MWTALLCYTSQWNWEPYASTYLHQSILIDKDPITELAPRNTVTFGSRMWLYGACRSKNTVTTGALVAHDVLSWGKEYKEIHVATVGFSSGSDMWWHHGQQLSNQVTRFDVKWSVRQGFHLGLWPSLIPLLILCVENRDSQCKLALVSWLCKCSSFCVAFQDPYNSLPIFS